jgi:hypothetical protein
MESTYNLTDRDWCLVRGSVNPGYARPEDTPMSPLALQSQPHLSRAVSLARQP